MMNNTDEYQPGPHEPSVTMSLVYTYENDNPIELPIKLC